MGNELKFTVINCENQEIKLEYFTMTSFLTDIESDKIDIPMLDDEIKDAFVYGKKTEVNTVERLYNLCLELENNRRI